MEKKMPECPKCGYKVREEMSFCPNCGASLKVEQVSTESRYVPPPLRRRNEKAEKYERGEKREKAEKHEKGEYGLIGPLIGGLILIFIGLASWLEITNQMRVRELWAFFLVMIGAIIIVGVIYAALMAAKRHPRTLEQ
jgi:hypothetical protein